MGKSAHANAGTPRQSAGEDVLDTTVETLKASAYPVLGIAYFSTHPGLWFSVLCHLLFVIAIDIALTITLFIVVFPLQSFALISAKCPPWAAWLSSFVFTLIESVVVGLVFALIYLPMIMDGLFDKVLSARGYEDQVKKAQKTAKRRCSRNASRCLHPIVFGLCTLFILPIALIPVLGWYIFFMFNGYFTAWGCHLHYYDMRLLTFGESAKYRRANWGSYLSFGMAAGGLQMIPIAGIFFMFTNAVAAALWAADLEESGRAPIPEQNEDAVQEELAAAATGQESSTLLNNNKKSSEAFWSFNEGPAAGSTSRV
ncbi:hypothetical protein HK096_005716 [Nowakowskiella sp. JEL0078]|nr:hypothetical protein HK096_005716 [Nowakowskiella sp. JEL0078]